MVLHLDTHFKSTSLTNLRMTILGGKQHSLGLLPLIGNIQGKRLFVSVYPFHFTLDHTAFRLMSPSQRCSGSLCGPGPVLLKALAWNVLSYASSVTTADIIMKEESLIKRRTSSENFNQHHFYVEVLLKYIYILNTFLSWKYTLLISSLRFLKEAS